MKKHNYHTILSLLQTCKTLRHLKQLHALMTTTSLIKQIIPLSKLIDFCTTSEEPHNLDYAQSIFIRIKQPSVYIWNSMIKGHSNTDKPMGSLLMYREMQQLGYSPDHFTFPFVLKACSLAWCVTFGKCVHTRILRTGFESDLYACTSLIQMYASCGDMEGGERVFDEMAKWNVVSWTTLISGYVNNGRASEAIRTFKEMEFRNVEPNEITLVNVLVACAQSRDIETGRGVHDRIRQSGLYPVGLNVVLDTAILDMYAKCGSLKTAKAWFNDMPNRNVVAWNVMIGAYNQYGWANAALRLFVDMRCNGINPDEATMLSLLGSCAQLGALDLGQELHAYVEKTNTVEDVAIGTALIDMYTKTGDMKSAFQIFNGLRRKDLIAWTSMIIGLAMHGHSEEALSLFSEMQRDRGVTPDHITYTGVLSACSHAGLVDEGYKHFNSMKSEYGLEPMEEHYGCMVDLLSRSGNLKEAKSLVETMPIQPNVTIWSALLNGCKIHDNVHLAEQVGNHISELKPQSGGVYVLLSNICAEAGRWEGVKRARDLMKHKGLERMSGWSSIETKLLSP